MTKEELKAVKTEKRYLKMVAMKYAVAIDSHDNIIYDFSTDEGSDSD